MIIVLMTIRMAMVRRGWGWDKDNDKEEKQVWYYEVGGGEGGC